MRFGIYGQEEGEFEAPLSLDALQQLADTVYERTGKNVAAVVSSHATRRVLIKDFLRDKETFIVFVPVETDRAFPDDLICMRTE